jgi:NCAIR mutase (PurE)-related protein
MNKERLKRLLKDVNSGRKSVGKALSEFESFPFEDMGFAKIDTHRTLRKGVPEVIFCRGKSIDQLKKIFSRNVRGEFMMATKANREIFDEVKKVKKEAVFYEKAGIIFAGKKKKTKGGKVLIITAGTSDIPVAEEAAVTAGIIGSRVERLYDVGVAGIHRLFSGMKKMKKARVIVVVAGMDGALASVVGGITENPVIAVPTSVGYGANFEGIAPLLTMLNSCAPGVAVVNIDNGFGAGYMAAMINRR